MGTAQAGPLSRHDPVTAGEVRTGGDIRTLLSYRLWKVTTANDRIAQRLIRDRFAISLPEWRLVGVTAALAPVGFSRLLGELDMDKGQASRLVKSLSHRGFLKSSPDPGDQRRVVLSLSAAGRRLHLEVLEFARQRNDVMLGHLTVETAKLLAEALDALGPALNRHLVELGETR